MSSTSYCKTKSIERAWLPRPRPQNGGRNPDEDRREMWKESTVSDCPRKE